MGIPSVYGFLFGIGRLIYGDILIGGTIVIVAAVLAYVVVVREASHES